MKQRGISFIELLIIVVVLGIIAAIVIPFMSGAREEAKKTVEAAKASAMTAAASLTNGNHKVLSKVSNGTGEETIVLENLKTGERSLLLTCTDDQKKMVVGDTVQFELDGNYDGAMRIGCGLIARRVG